MTTEKMLRSGITVGGWTLGSRVLGLVRDIVLANSVGASAGADAFFVAFKIPNFLRRLFGEGAFAQAFVPVFSETREKDGEVSVKRLIDQVAGRFGLILVAISILGVLLAPWIAMLFAPGFSDDSGKLALTADLLRWTFPYLGFICFVAFAGGILNSVGRFAVPAATPIFLNLSLIGSTLFLVPLVSPSVLGLAIGVAIAGLIQLLIQIPPLISAGLLPKPSLQADHPGVSKILKLMVPALFGVSVSQINLLLDTVLASLLVSGSVSWLYYSDRLMELPLGVVAIAVSTVILPKLSREFAQDDVNASRQTQSWAIWVVLVLGLPCAAALAVFGELILSTLFQYGAMTARDIEASALSLMAYALGLPAFMMIKVLAPHYFAHQDTKTPVKIGLIAMTANMGFNLILVWSLDHVGLALATSLSAWVNAILLLHGLHRRGWYEVRGLPWKPALQVGFALILMVQVGWWAPTASVLADHAIIERIGWTTLLLIVSGLLYLVTLRLTGIRYTSLLVSPSAR
ncbi:MAG: murein biosynthesis integral membrane protein MurJ [Pseudomonadota bacterium]|nr:murein biosynthesis integral membrane protein MurJ [Pseudomonadota bacterium]MEE2821093.1 murein biosynthesis integral membrane protein MurJ [Pseudomonadota bacterium]